MSKMGAASLATVIVLAITTGIFLTRFSHRKGNPSPSKLVASQVEKHYYPPVLPLVIGVGPGCLEMTSSWTGMVRFRVDRQGFSTYKLVAP